MKRGGAPLLELRPYWEIFGTSFINILALSEKSELSEKLKLLGKLEIL